MPKQTNLRKPFVLLFLVWWITSCKKDINSPYQAAYGTPSNFSQAFDEFWDQMNTNYVFWDIDTTNWDAVYSVYKPAFSKLDLQNKSDVEKSVQYLRQITDALVDSHLKISFTDTLVIDSNISPSFDRKIRSPTFHNPFPYIRIDTNYLDANYLIGYDSTSNPGQVPIYCLFGTINQNILYFTCSEFALFESYTSAENNGVKPVLNAFFNALSNANNWYKGIIIDVRGNPGGDLADLNFIIGKLIDKPLHFGSTRFKSGNGRLDYTPWVDAIVNPTSANTVILQVPVIVLADNFSVSLAELMTMAVRSLPTGLFIGETTWGATGSIVAGSLLNDGPFSVPGYLTVYMASSEFKYLDNKNYEGTGFPPDVNVPFNEGLLNSGDDIQLDSAINRAK
jgi:carboxyl-terminal processing protease